MGFWSYGWTMESLVLFTKAPVLPGRGKAWLWQARFSSRASSPLTPRWGRQLMAFLGPQPAPSPGERWAPRQQGWERLCAGPAMVWGHVQPGALCNGHLPAEWVCAESPVWGRAAPRWVEEPHLEPLWC